MATTITQPTRARLTRILLAYEFSNLGSTGHTATGHAASVNAPAERQETVRRHAPISPLPPS